MTRGPTTVCLGRRPVAGTVARREGGHAQHSARRPDARVGEHPRRVPLDHERGGVDQFRTPVAVGRNAEVEGDDVLAAHEVVGEREGVGAARVLDLHDRCAEPRSTFPMSGVAHVVPKTTTVASRTDGRR